MNNTNDKKIFCIGQNKTGTTSMAFALEDLGYSVLRVRDFPTGMIDDCLHHNYEKVLSCTKNKEAFEDRPFNIMHVYQFLYSCWPNAKFILTVRKEEDWWNSVNNWLSIKRKSFLTEEKRLHKIEVYKKHYETNKFCRESFIKYYSHYNQSTINYFQNNNNFIVFNIFSGDGWKKLCSFLEKPIPNHLFPWKNKNVQ